MGKSSRNKQPSPPDPYDVVDAQTDANRDTAVAQTRLNQINEYTPFGSAVWSPTGQTIDGIDQYQRTVTLSPQEQALYDQQNALQQQVLGYAGPQLDRLNNILSQDFNFDQLGPAPEANDETRQRVENALYQRARGYLDPQFEQDQRALETQLVNSGFTRGSEAYDAELQKFRANKGNVYGNAMWDAIAQGGAEQSRLYGLEANARERVIQEMAAQRSQPLNEWATLLGQSGGVNVPTFSAPPQTQVAGTDVASNVWNAYKAQQDQYNQAQNQQNSFWGALSGLGSAALGGWATTGFAPFSDENLKENLEPTTADVLRKNRDLPHYTYNYKGQDQTEVGPMAQDLEKAFPGSTMDIDGHRAISPTAFFGLPLAAVSELTKRVEALEAA